MERNHPKRGNLLYQNQSKIAFIINSGGNKTINKIDRYKSKKGASASEVLALFNCSTLRWTIPSK